MSAYDLSIGKLRNIEYFSKNHMGIDDLTMVEEDFYILKFQEKVYALSLYDKKSPSKLNEDFFNQLEKSGIKLSNLVASGNIDDFYSYRLEDASGTISMTEYLRENQGEKAKILAEACAKFFVDFHKPEKDEMKKSSSTWLDQIRERILNLSEKPKHKNSKKLKSLDYEYIFEDMIKEYFYYLDANPRDLIFGNINQEKMRVDGDGNLIFFGLDKFQIGEYAYDLTFLADIHLVNPIFTRTFINLYFDGKVPKKFFKVFAVYTSLKILELISYRDKMKLRDRENLEEKTRRIMEQLSRIDNLSEFWEKQVK